MTKEEYVYIGEDTVPRLGKEAVELLEKNKHFETIDEQNGIIRASLNRWEVAQKYEKTAWMEANKDAMDDRNKYFYKNFDDYKVLNNMHFKNAIELGCGPFTNLRLIANSCKISKCSLLDPLINSYLNHKNCVYKNNKLKVEKLSSNTDEHIDVENMFESSIEEMPTDEKYDLVVMINVLEHCYDLDKIFKNIIKILDSNAIFVFKDKCYNIDLLKKYNNQLFDAGHPIKASKTYLTDFLNKYFDTLLLKYVQMDECYRGENAQIWDEIIDEKILFIGKYKF